MLLYFSSPAHSLQLQPSLYMATWLAIILIPLVIICVRFAFIIGQIRKKTYELFTPLYTAQKERIYRQEELFNIVFTDETIKRNLMNDLAVSWVLESYCHKDGHFIAFVRQRNGVIKLSPYSEDF
jgi:hypothetical protein